MNYIPYNHDKKKRNKSSSNKAQYKESKAFKVFVTVALGALLATGAFNTVKELYDNSIGKVKDTVETVEKVQEFTENIKDNSTSNSSNAKVENTSGIELDVDDIKDIIEKLDEAINSNNVQSKISDMIILNYYDADTIDKYTKNILDEMQTYDKTVTFVMVVDTIQTNEEATDKINNIKEIMNETHEIVKASKFNKNMISAISNVPNNGNLVIAITFIQ